METEHSDPRIWEKLQVLDRTEVLLLASGSLLILFGVFILICFLRRQPKKIVAYTTENGQVMVRRSAIVELVRTACDQLHDVSKPKIKILVKRGVTNLNVEIKLQSGGRLRAIEEMLQTHLRTALSENLGIEKLGYVNIVATGFKSGRIAATKPNKPMDETKVDPVEDTVEVSETATETKPE